MLTWHWILLRVCFLQISVYFYGTLHRPMKEPCVDSWCGSVGFVVAALWWPIWLTISCTDDPNDYNTSDDINGGSHNGADDVTGYCSDIDSSGSNNSDDDDNDNDDDDQDGDDCANTWWSWMNAQEIILTWDDDHVTMAKQFLAQSGYIERRSTDTVLFAFVQWRFKLWRVLNSVRVFQCTLVLVQLFFRFRFSYFPRVPHR